MNKLKEVMDAKEPKVWSKELAREVGVTTRMIDLVRNQSGIGVETALRIAEFLEVEITEIFDVNGFDKGKKSKII